MRGANTRIDHVGFNTGTGGRIAVGRRERKVALVDAIQPPGCACLRGRERDLTIFFHEGDAWIKAKTSCRSFRPSDRKPQQRVLVNTLNRSAMNVPEISGDGG